jgi:hypothetical protein
MALVGRFLLISQTQLVTPAGRTYLGTLGNTIDIPISDALSINPGTAAVLVCFVGSTSDRPAINSAASWNVPVVTSMYDTTASKFIFYRADTKTWIDQTGATA